MKWIGVLLLLAVCGCTTIGDRLEGARTPREIAQATADYYVEDAQDESCSVAVVTPKGTWFASAGSANERSLFRIASLSKLHLHLMLHGLHRRGCLDLDRSVAGYSKLSLPPEYAKVTMRDLLMNRSGLPREFMVHWEPFDTFKALRCGLFGGHLYSGFDRREDLAKLAWRPWWRHAVRHPREIYSNVGFGLLGTAVEDALGKPLETVLREELVGPMALTDTTYEPAGELSNRVTRACAGHLPWLVARRHDVPDHRLGDALRAAGGLFSSARDCARVFEGYWRLIDEQRRERSLEQCGDDAVYGLLRVKALPSGRKVLYRAGMVYGGASFVGFDPVDRTMVVILRNVTSWPDERGFVVMDSLSRAACRAESKSAPQGPAAAGSRGI